LGLSLQRRTEPRYFADPSRERFATAANMITIARTVATVGFAMLAAGQQQLVMLLIALAIYWAGDVADGTYARLTNTETRIGAVLDIVSDRFCAAVFYVGLVWLEPDLWLPVAVYLIEFMVIDLFVSLSSMAWPVVSPNYFHVIDRRLWLWNWSKPAKAVNSAAFAVFLVLTGSVWLGTAIALGLLGFKIASMVRLMRIGLPVPVR
jgi:CDP-diacylglycerol--glycerol-3-phosphate 3-phosphatidyltransferase